MSYRYQNNFSGMAEDVVESCVKLQKIKYSIGSVLLLIISLILLGIGIKNLINPPFKNETKCMTPQEIQEQNINTSDFGNPAFPKPDNVMISTEYGAKGKLRQWPDCSSPNTWVTQTTDKKDYGPATGTLIGGIVMMGLSAVLWFFLRNNKAYQMAGCVRDTSKLVGSAIGNIIGDD